MQTAHQSLLVVEHLFPFCQSVDFAAQVKTLQERNAAMEKKMAELKIQIQVIAVLLHVCLDNSQGLMIDAVSSC